MNEILSILMILFSMAKEFIVNLVKSFWYFRELRELEKYIKSAGDYRDWEAIERAERRISEIFNYQDDLEDEADM